jgi:hypothetical protein
MCFLIFFEDEVVAGGNGADIEVDVELSFEEMVQG